MKIVLIGNLTFAIGIYLRFFRWWLEPKSEATGCGPVDSGSITRQPPIIYANYISVLWYYDLYFYDDHNEPHFHAYYGEYEAEVSIKTGMLIKGKLPPSAKKLIKKWMDEHKRELLEGWNLAMQHKKLKSLDPLE